MKNPSYRLEALWFDGAITHRFLVGRTYCAENLSALEYRINKYLSDRGEVNTVKRASVKPTPSNFSKSEQCLMAWTNNDPFTHGFEYWIIDDWLPVKHTRCNLPFMGVQKE